MVQKDWKKNNDDEIGFSFINKKLHLEIDYSIKMKRLQVYRHYKNISDIIISKHIKTKSQALKYAKSYMRKH